MRHLGRAEVSSLSDMHYSFARPLSGSPFRRRPSLVLGPAGDCVPPGAIWDRVRQTPLNSRQSIMRRRYRALKPATSHPALLPSTLPSNSFARPHAPGGPPSRSRRGTWRGVSEFSRSRSSRGASQPRRRLAHGGHRGSFDIPGAFFLPSRYYRAYYHSGHGIKGSEAEGTHHQSSQLRRQQKGRASSDTRMASGKSAIHDPTFHRHHTAPGRSWRTMLGRRWKGLAVHYERERHVRQRWADQDRSMPQW